MFRQPGRLPHAMPVVGDLVRPNDWLSAVGESTVHRNARELAVVLRDACDVYRNKPVRRYTEIAAA